MLYFNRSECWYGSSARMCNKILFFLFLNQYIYRGYSKESSQWDDSFEHPKHMLKLMGKKMLSILCINFCLSKPVLYLNRSECWYGSSDGSGVSGSCSWYCTRCILGARYSYSLCWLQVSELIMLVIAFLSRTFLSWTSLSEYHYLEYLYLEQLFLLHLYL